MLEREKLFRIIWWIYFLALFFFVSLKFDGSLASLAKRLFAGEPSYNLRPLKTLTLQWKYFSSTWGRRNMLGNIVPFIPLGFLTPKAYEKFSNAPRFFHFTFCLIFFIELFQLFSRLGSFDVDDILLNMAGAALGYALLPGKRRQDRPSAGVQN